jgi:rhamnosyltransferase
MDTGHEAASSSHQTPRVLVLLATCNGEPWLDEQLASLWAQHGVQVRVLASDDASTDNTRTILEAHTREHPLVLLPTAQAASAQAAPSDAAPTRLGACANFMRLVCKADAGEADYIALCDQDDVWLPGKLARAIECLQQTQAHAYSSSFHLWLPAHDRREFVCKHHAQTAFDHLIQSPGPGCSFVLCKTLFADLQQWACAGRAEPLKSFYHDWLIYAFARKNAWRWHIDDQSHLLYRQHARNLSSSDTSLAAHQTRLAKMRSGWWSREVVAVSTDLGLQHQWPASAFARLGVLDRIGLALQVHRLCRSMRDRIALTLCLLLGILRKPRP